jgi:hypothetical protein
MGEFVKIVIVQNAQQFNGLGPVTDQGFTPLLFLKFIQPANGGDDLLTNFTCFLMYSNQFFGY